MKKIKHIKDLEHEKLKLRVKQLELEKKMNNSWKDLKGNLSSKNFNGSEHNTGFKKMEGDNLFSGVVNFGAGVLSHKLGQLAGKNAEIVAGNIITKVAEKIGTVFTKKKKAKK